MHFFRTAAMATALFAMAGTAHAQSWGFSFGYGRSAQPDWQAQRRVDWVCSGQRAHQLEGRLRHEVEEGDIDPGTSERMHFAIDDLERRQQHECYENDWRSVWRIADRYDRIEGWMNNEAGRSHWRGW